MPIGSSINRAKELFNTLEPKKRILFAVIALVLVLALCVGIRTYKTNFFDRVVHQMMKDNRYADNAQAADGSYLKIDTNPNNEDDDSIFYNVAVEQDSLNAIKFVNEKLGFSDSLYQKMLSTTALMGRQTEENKKFVVSWTYHPDKGLEVMYEKK